MALLQHPSGDLLRVEAVDMLLYMLQQHAAQHSHSDYSACPISCVFELLKAHQGNSPTNLD